VIEYLDIANLSDILDTLNNGQQIALPAELKLSLNAYLSDLSYSPVRSLAEVIAFNNAHPVEVISSGFQIQIHSIPYAFCHR
jgi:amidase